MQKEPDALVIVHGIWMHDIVMRLLGKRLRDAGYRTYFFNYSSRGDDVRHEAQRFLQWLESRVSEPRVHFVAHSLGGLVVLEMLSLQRFARLGRVVTLGSPLNGSAVAQRLNRSRFGRWLLGGALDALCRGAPRLPVGLCVGSIVGTVSVGLGRCLAPLSVPNDGTVALLEGGSQGCADIVALPVTHFGMLIATSVTQQVVYFLRNGHFVQATHHGGG